RPTWYHIFSRILQSIFLFVDKKRVAETFPALLLIRQVFSRAKAGLATAGKLRRFLFGRPKVAPDMSLTRDLPIRSVGFPPTNAVHPPASQHGAFILFAPLYLGCARSARPLPRGFTGHVAHPIRSIQISDF